MTEENKIILLRNDSEANFVANNTNLLKGEIALISEGVNFGRMKNGPGNFNNLPYNDQFVIDKIPPKKTDALNVIPDNARTETSPVVSVMVDPGGSTGSNGLVALKAESFKEWLNMWEKNELKSLDQLFCPAPVSSSGIEGVLVYLSSPPETGKPSMTDGTSFKEWLNMWSKSETIPGSAIGSGIPPENIGSGSIPCEYIDFENQPQTTNMQTGDFYVVWKDGSIQLYRTGW